MDFIACKKAELQKISQPCMGVIYGNQSLMATGLFIEILVREVQFIFTKISYETCREGLLLYLKKETF